MRAELSCETHRINRIWTKTGNPIVLCLSYIRSLPVSMKTLPLLSATWLKTSFRLEHCRHPEMQSKALGGMCKLIACLTIDGTPML